MRYRKRLPHYITIGTVRKYFYNNPEIEQPYLTKDKPCLTITYSDMLSDDRLFSLNDRFFLRLSVLLSRIDYFKNWRVSLSELIFSDFY